MFRAILAGGFAGQAQRIGDNLHELGVELTQHIMGDKSVPTLRQADVAICVTEWFPGSRLSDLKKACSKRGIRLLYTSSRIGEIREALLKILPQPQPAQLAAPAHEPQEIEAKKDGKEIVPALPLYTQLWAFRVTPGEAASLLRAIAGELKEFHRNLVAGENSGVYRILYERAYLYMSPSRDVTPDIEMWESTHFVRRGETENKSREIRWYEINKESQIAVPPGTYLKELADIAMKVPAVEPIPKEVSKSTRFKKVYAEKGSQQRELLSPVPPSAPLQQINHSTPEVEAPVEETMRPDTSNMFTPPPLNPSQGVTVQVRLTAKQHERLNALVEEGFSGVDLEDVIRRILDEHLSGK